MFKNVGNKLKVLAQVIAAVGIAGSVLIGIIMMSAETVIQGIYILLYGGIGSVIISFCLYGFGEMIENVSKIAEDTAALKRESCSGASEYAEKLETLRKWNQEGLISEEEYEQKKNMILKK